MMLNLGRRSAERERLWLQPAMWIGPGILVGVLFLMMLYVIVAGGTGSTSGAMVGPKAVGEKLFGPYLLAVELAAVLLLAALIGAYHLGRRYLSDRRQEPSS